MKKYIGGFEDETDIKEHSKMIHTCLFKTILVGHYNHLEKLSQNREYQILSLSDQLWISVGGIQGSLFCRSFPDDSSILLWLWSPEVDWEVPCGKTSNSKGIEEHNMDLQDLVLALTSLVILYGLLGIT